MPVSRPSLNLSANVEPGATSTEIAASALTLDAFPLDPTESIDTDGDGVGDNGDLCPDTPVAELGGVNEEGCGVSERDTDGDGVNDDLDAFPLDPTETKDSDGDGFGDNLEIAEGTDPFGANDQPFQPPFPLWLILQSRGLEFTAP